MIDSAILVAIGGASTALAFLRVVNDIALPLFFLGVMLMGAGALYPFRRAAWGMLGGFVLAVYLSTPVVHITNNPDETFNNVPKELGAETEVSTKADSR